MDCALDSTIFSTISASGCPLENLYTLAWQSGLSDIAPHLVELVPQAAFSQELLSWDWYGNWGYFVQAQAPLKELAASLSALTIVSSPDAKDAFFRFFDPRVLRPFLDASSEQDLRLVFAKASRFVVPMLDDGLRGEGAIVYAMNNDVLTKVGHRFTQ
jgi:hypothetical protein